MSEVKHIPEELMNKHTPGPWKARLNEEPQWWICGPKGEFQIIATTSQGNDKANANLMATAPEMLKALEDILFDHDLRIKFYPDANSQPNRLEVMKNGRQIIAKAKGG